MDIDERRIFSSARSVIMPLPGLRPGVTAVIEYVTRFRSGDWPLPWAQHYQIATGSPIERIEIAVAWDRGVPAPRFATDEARLACETSERSIHCSMQEVDALPMDPDLTAYLDVAPQLVIAAPRSWQQVADRARELVEQKIRSSAPVAAPAHVLAGKASDEERWAALYRFVTDEIRYLGLEHQTSSVVPHEPAVTLGRRFGDCKDKVTLFVALARQAGLDAYPALVGSLRHVGERLLLPSPSYFDHMIACRIGAEGRPDCVDLTVNHTTPADSVLALNGAVALPLREGAGAPISLDASPHGWRIAVDKQAEVGCDGSIAMRLTRTMDGLASAAYRAGLEGISPTEQQRRLQEEYRSSGYSKRAPEFEVAGLEDPAGSISIAHSDFVPSSTSLLEQGSVLDDDRWLSLHGLSFRSANRHLPYLNPGLQLRSVARYSLCEKTTPGFTGPALRFTSRFGSLTRDYRRDPREIVVTSTLELPASQVTPEDLEAFNRFLETTLDQSDVWFSVRAAGR